MKATKEAMYEVASGEIEEPSIEAEIDGQKITLKGNEAKIFALGVLVGLKATSEESNNQQ